MALTFTPIVSDSFQRANENPLDPTHWESNGILPEEDNLEILNNVCTTTILDTADGQATYIDDSLPNDQYMQVQVEQLSVNGGIYLYLRTIETQNTGQDIHPCYRFTLAGPIGPGGSGATWDVDIVNASDSSVYDWNPDGYPVTVHLHDVFTFAVAGAAGGKWYVLQNGTVVGQGNLSDSGLILTSGRVGMQVANTNPDSTPEQDDAAVINFVAGGVKVELSTPTSGSNAPGSYAGKTLLAAFYNPSQMDLLQVIDAGDGVVWNLTYDGVANVRPSNPTPRALLGTYYGSSFATAFPNPNKLDIFQLIGPGGGIVFHVDYAGVANIP